MKISETVDYVKYIEYRNFINKCSMKKYDESLNLQMHHIIPKHIGGKDNKENLVLLSIEDHIKAHILFSDCFDKGSYEWNSNLKSARIINKFGIISKNDFEKIKESYIGENNPFYGKKHNSETIKKLKIHTMENRKNVSYEELYGDRSIEEKRKRSESAKRQHIEMTDEERKKRSESISNSLKGKPAWNKGKKSKYLVDGVVFNTLDDALEFYGYKYPKKLKDNHIIERIK